MANEQNLLKGRATQFQSGEKAARSGRKGGKASGAAKRARKSRRELAEELAGAKIQDPKLRDQLQALGFGKSDLIYDTLIVAGVFQNAAAGDIKAVEKWEEWTREQAGREETQAQQLDSARLAFRELLRDLAAEDTDGAE